ncbi:MAG: AraC family transcriptional regulator [Thermomicrobiales bacterium]
MSQISTPNDPLGEALHFLRMSGTFYCRCDLGAPWGVEMPAMPGSLMFHVVISGECWVEVDGSAPQVLRQGDLAVIPHGVGHRIASGASVLGPMLFDLQREEVSRRYEILRYGHEGATTHLLCGVAQFDHPAAAHLVQVLPGLIVAEASRLGDLEWLNGTLQFISAEAGALRPGGETMITRLADVLVIQAIRAWVEDEGVAQAGWLSALRNPQIGRALALMHREPQRGWTVEALAQEAAMSRSAFAARFSELAGEPPMLYLTRWRMNLALTRLGEEGPTLSHLATELGYQSEAAFSRAFKRYMGVSPGAVRREQRNGALLAGEDPHFPV